MAENIISQSVLIESQSARDQTLSGISDERSLLVLQKAKAAIQAAWQNTELATVEQVAEYYEVGIEAIKTIIKRFATEIARDGAKKLVGKELRSQRFRLNLCENVNSAWVFTPRAFLRVGFILSESPIASEVRTQSLDLIQAIPSQVAVINQQSDRLRELELQNEVLTKQLQLRQLDNNMLALHGAPIVLALRGMSNQLIEITKPTTEVIDEKTGAKFSGQTLVQLKDYIAAKHGIKFKSGADVERRLEKAGRHDLIAQMKRPVLQSYIPLEFIDQAIAVLTNGDRQLFIGE